MDSNPDILLSLEEHFPTPIMASQPPLTSIAPMDDPHEVSTQEIFYQMDQLLAVYLNKDPSDQYH